MYIHVCTYDPVLLSVVMSVNRTSTNIPVLMYQLTCRRLTSLHQYAAGLNPCKLSTYFPIEPAVVRSPETKIKIRSIARMNLFDAVPRPIIQNRSQNMHNTSSVRFLCCEWRKNTCNDQTWCVIHQLECILGHDRSPLAESYVSWAT